MLELNKKLEALKRRVAPLEIPESVILEIGATLRLHARRVKYYYSEWLSDAVDYDQAEYIPAQRDPQAHFRRWVEARMKDPFRVSDLAIQKVRRRYNVDFGNRFCLIVWPQEIAWAQRFRSEHNIFQATKAALFLSQAQDDTKSVFSALADLHADAWMTAEYLNSPFHEMSPDEIRNSSEVPDFTPLFLRYANQAFEEKLSSLTTDMFQQFAKRAALDEQLDRQKEMRVSIVEQAHKFPLRHAPTVIAMARKNRISPNELFLLEHHFLENVVDGKFDVPPGSVSGLPIFVSLLTDKKTVRTMLLEAVKNSTEISIPVDLWSVINFQRSWLDQLPPLYKDKSDLLSCFQQWKSSLVEGVRPMPIDSTSDFLFFVQEQTGTVA